jgi:ABC-type nitrate/sulfonate/bicarbonate transport system substrate-binding protein
MGLRGLLKASGLDPVRDDIRIGPVPRTGNAGTNFGLMAAEALERGEIDGFWANGMAAEIAVTGQIGTIVLDVRRGDGPPGCFNYTMPVLIATDRLIELKRDTAAAAIRALVACQRALRDEPSRAAEVGRRRFPLREAALIVPLVERDLPFYDAAISEAALAAIVDFTCRMGVLKRRVPYAEAVAAQYRALWSGTG